MKIFSFIALSLFCFGIVSAQEEESLPEPEAISVSTYYLVRHAEKDRSNPKNKDPHLTQDGLLRAAKWSLVFENIKFDAIYSTKYMRTMETAAPTAERNGIKELKFYDPSDLDISEFLNETKGMKVLIVGHSNTTPEFVNRIIGQDKYEHISDRNNSNLYIVTVSSNGVISDQLLVIN